MAFLKRLGWYLVGFSVGIVFLVFFLKKKADGTGTEFCYFPNCRVLKDLRAKPIRYENGLEAQFETDSILWRSFFKEGDIDFGQSDTKSTPCKTYFISNDTQTMKVENCPDEVVVISIN
ncbi:MAG: DUF4258 domain-containing protein [Croceitalea sp.]|nr:DUF4258 domain-containing protein [Croceitalea sp.]MBT8237660.1 DUF4258 domain-containing protein [Croceitalea sp.]NNC34789.1 DUF4258 domain-containing protein [Croceitalea sp.]NNL07927.1 DUF4258 domain-containing protein [Croceitalea sp.]NNM17267.1 DUF4258 domain-containing protein [Croceitalea sp.]